MIAVENLTERHTEHLATLVEGGLDHATEQLLVAPKIGNLVTCHADNGALHLGRRIEHTWLDGEEILYMIPSLNEHREDAVLLVAGLRGHAHSYLVLNHTGAAGNEVLIVEHLEEYLRRDVVRIIAGKHKLLPVEHLAKVHAQEIAGDNIVREARKILLQILYTLAVDLDYLEGTGLLYQILGHDTHARTNLQHWDVGTGIDGIGNALGDIQVGQEVLTEIFLGSNLFHGYKGTNKREKFQIKNKKIADLEICDSFFNFSRSITYCCLH